MNTCKQTHSSRRAFLKQSGAVLADVIACAADVPFAARDLSTLDDYMLMMRW